MSAKLFFFYPPVVGSGLVGKLFPQTRVTTLAAFISCHRFLRIRAWQESLALAARPLRTDLGVGRVEGVCPVCRMTPGTVHCAYVLPEWCLDLAKAQLTRTCLERKAWEIMAGVRIVASVRPCASCFHILTHLMFPTPL